MKRESINNFSGGVINKVNPQKIPNNTLTLAKNYEYNKRPIPVKRKSVDISELQNANIRNIRSFDVWYPNRILSDMADDKIYVIHTLGIDGNGNAEIEIYDTLEFWFYTLVNVRSDIQSYTIVGKNIKNSILITTPTIDGLDYFYIRNNGDGSWQHSLVLTPDDDGNVYEQINMSFLPLTVVTDMSGNIVNAGDGKIENVIVHGTSYELPQKDYLIWLLENYQQLTGDGSGKVLKWTSVDGKYDYAFAPVGTSGGYTTAELRPLHITTEAEQMKDNPVVKFERIVDNNTATTRHLNATYPQTGLNIVDEISELTLIVGFKITQEVPSNGENYHSLTAMWGTRQSGYEGRIKMFGLASPIKSNDTMRHDYFRVYYRYTDDLVGYASYVHSGSLCDGNWHIMVVRIRYSATPELRNISMFMDGVRVFGDYQHPSELLYPGDGNQYHGMLDDVYIGGDRNIGSGLGDCTNAFYGEQFINACWNKFLTLDEIEQVFEYYKYLYGLDYEVSIPE